MKNDVVIFLCDDNHVFIDIIQTKIKDILTSKQRSYKIYDFSTGETLIKAFSHSEPDVIFLDIDMPHMTGFEAAERLQKIKPSVNIVFITSHEDKVFQSYEFHPFWFVRKSHLEDLVIVLDKLISKIDAENAMEQKFTKLISENKTIEIDITKVIYIQAYKHYIIIKHLDGSEKQIRCKISDAERQLLAYDFIRIQNSIIVNCRFITKVTSKMIVLQDKDEFSVSRDRSEHVKATYQKFMRST